MKAVVIESPYAGDVETNLEYLAACMADCIKRGEAPFASHGLYTMKGVLRDEVPEERRKGIEAGFVWSERADLVAVYIDRGISPGMREGAIRALRADQHLEYRSLSGEVDKYAIPCIYGRDHRKDDETIERNGHRSSDLVVIVKRHQRFVCGCPL